MGWSLVGSGVGFKSEPLPLIEKFKNLKVLKNLINVPGFYSKQYSNNKANKEK